NRHGWGLLLLAEGRPDTKHPHPLTRAVGVATGRWTAMRMPRPIRWLSEPMLALMLALMNAPLAHAAGDAASHLAVPRFVSLKSDKVNVRSGPTKDHDVTWIYTRAGLPVEITAEFENWRRIRDWEGAEGWVYHSLLSGRRTGLVQPSAKATDEYIPIYASA